MLKINLLKKINKSINLKNILKFRKEELIFRFIFTLIKS